MPLVSARSMIYQSRYILTPCDNSHAQEIHDRYTAFQPLPLFSRLIRQQQAFQSRDEGKLRTPSQFCFCILKHISKKYRCFIPSTLKANNKTIQYVCRLSFDLHPEDPFLSAMHHINRLLCPLNLISALVPKRMTERDITPVKV